jgi:hypothetical protein
VRSGFARNVGRCLWRQFRYGSDTANAVHNVEYGQHTRCVKQVSITRVLWQLTLALWAEGRYSWFSGMLLVGAQRWMSFLGYFVLRVVISPSCKELQIAAGESTGSNSRSSIAD